MLQHLVFDPRIARQKLRKYCRRRRTDAGEVSRAIPGGTIGSTGDKLRLPTSDLLAVFAPQNSVNFHVHILAPFADVLTACAFVFHPELLQDASGGRVVRKMTSMNAVKLHLIESKL